MKLNVEAIQKLVEDRFNGQLSKFVNELKMDYSYVNQIVKGHKSPGSKKLCDKVIDYCKRNNLDFHEFIFF